MIGSVSEIRRLISGGSPSDVAPISRKSRANLAHNSRLLAPFEKGLLALGQRREHAIACGSTTKQVCGAVRGRGATAKGCWWQRFAALWRGNGATAKGCWWQ
eukprot:1933184-Pleurochrysis_carterae.AAC.1